MLHVCVAGQRVEDERVDVGRRKGVAGAVRPCRGAHVQHTQVQPARDVTGVGAPLRVGDGGPATGAAKAIELIIEKTRKCQGNCPYERYTRK